MIRELVDSWEETNIANILVMDFGSWVDQLVDVNAKLMGMDQTMNNYTLERLGCFKYPPSLAMACATLEKRTDCTCVRNMMSIDGMHWCMETMAGRILGGTSCLLQCSLLSIEGTKTGQRDIVETRKAQKRCEQSCNDTFMSLRKAPSLSLTNDIASKVSREDKRNT